MVSLQRVLIGPDYPCFGHDKCLGSFEHWSWGPVRRSTMPNGARQTGQSPASAMCSIHAIRVSASSPASFNFRSGSRRFFGTSSPSSAHGSSMFDTSTMVDLIWSNPALEFPNPFGPPSTIPNGVWPASGHQWKQGISSDKSSNVRHVGNGGVTSEANRVERSYQLKSKIEQGNDGHRPRPNQNERERNFITRPAREVCSEQTICSS